MTTQQLINYLMTTTTNDKLFDDDDNDKLFDDDDNK